jgi:hypothetical protein
MFQRDLPLKFSLKIHSTVIVLIFIQYISSIIVTLIYRKYRPAADAIPGPHMHTNEIQA